MKNVFKYLLTALAAAIGLSFAACGDGGEEGNGGGGNGFLGATLAISGAQVYTTDIDYENLEIIYVPYEGGIAGLDYIYVPDAAGESGEYLPLSGVFDGEKTAALTNGKLSISFGTPKAFAMISVDLIKAGAPDLTISAGDAKLFMFTQITNNEQRQSVICDGIIYIYVNKNVAISGTDVQYDESDGSMTTLVYDMDLKTGWNAVMQNIAQTDGNAMAGTLKTGKPTGNEKWLYMDSDD